ncbi:ABC-type transport system periplasmic substrate-binding protein (probable substrate glutamine/glutamate/polar amino acids) [Natronomonas pharaonis DSM 2160]|uniref:ABC-type transport system periplasmic substrate-binding protein (Probable substrate glutamine/glutamate/polar amino acids) n=1 Tax=Natronomonas pharaonis (strain ATCC 35678 / DSM 2160 / CIP 103997 / JCM 8858 / NBRC 14720 / NCIMB 2260 / Gabara) TaxID=348780 RepID=A0A1U7EVF4_NATPD|nr:transporter substrate-binding domain-containing protein [Natronomonas pharaonis]CAI48978.1 ABC-type transport system periplasmic substrate-binding protein (probable substrate glutamine/glutamate/polar amino acids) [Natronomonas pharaonis DSM 2160]
MESDPTLDRRSYLSAVGAAGLAAGAAGCVGLDDGNGDGNGDGNDDDSDDDSDDDTRTIVAGTAPGFPPFEFRQDGELLGFDIDLTEAVIERSDYEFGGWETFEFDSLIPALQNGNIDVIAAAMTIEDERREQIAFSDAYYEADQSVLVRSDDDDLPQSREDLSGSIVGAQGGTTGENEVDRLIDDGIIPESDKNVYDNYTLAATDLENGNIDAVVVDVPVARTFSEDLAVEVAFEIETGEEYGFGIRQDDEELVAAVNDGLEAVTDDGTYNDLVAEWFE